MKNIERIVTALSASLIAVCNAVLGVVRAFILGNPKARIEPGKCIVVITGCDSGFGEMAASRLSQMGFKVVAGCLTQDGVERMRAVAASAVLCDVTKESNVVDLRVATEALMESTKSNLWGVVNNAGIAIGGPLDWISLDVYRKVMEVNFFGHVSVTMQMLPLLKRTSNSRVLNISSVAGIACSANLSAYGASKHAMEGFLKSVRQELKPWGIHMSNINPAFMRTPMAVGSAGKNVSQFEALPEETRKAYEDPRPKFIEGEKLIDKTLEDPKLVVDAIVEGLTDAAPRMWYFPGYGASAMRMFSMASSDTCDYVLMRGVEGTVHVPKPDAVKQAHSKAY